MKPAPFGLHMPASLDEALQLMFSLSNARTIAGALAEFDVEISATPVSSNDAKRRAAACVRSTLQEA